MPVERQLAAGVLNHLGEVSGFGKVHHQMGIELGWQVVGKLRVHDRIPAGKGVGGVEHRLVFGGGLDGIGDDGADLDPG